MLDGSSEKSARSKRKPLPTKIEDFPYYIEAVGFKNAAIDDVELLFKKIRQLPATIIVQLFDADLVAGREHLFFAALNALTAFRNRNNISNNMAIEILLYASAERQIAEAFRKIGVKTVSQNIAAVIMAKQPSQIDQALSLLQSLLGCGRHDSVLEPTPRKAKRIMGLFGISDVELQAKRERRGSVLRALGDLVVEHMALLATQR